MQKIFALLVLAVSVVSIGWGCGEGKNTTLRFTVHGVPFEMVYVQGGTYTMGCPAEQYSCESDESPTHSVSLSNYYMGRYQVTQQLWEAVMGTSIQRQRYKAGESSLYGVGHDYPMYYISYTECEELVERLNRLLADQLPSGFRFGLPTEAQWEYAARGGILSKGYEYSGSPLLDRVAWYDSNSDNGTHPVGSKEPNELGLYDMCGNVWEWCYDWYGSYGTAAQTDPLGASSGSRRVHRGGSWTTVGQHCRIADRGSDAPSYRDSSNGVRLSLGQ